MHVRRVEKKAEWCLFRTGIDSCACKHPSRRSHSSSSHFLSVVALWSENTREKSVNYQNSSSYRCDGVPSLSPVHIALAVPTSDPVQETWHVSGSGVSGHSIAWKRRQDPKHRRHNESPQQKSGSFFFFFFFFLTKSWLLSPTTWFNKSVGCSDSWAYVRNNESPQLLIWTLNLCNTNSKINPYTVFALCL